MPKFLMAIICSLLVIGSGHAFAADATENARSAKGNLGVAETGRRLRTILLSGACGGTLGLSTLSFYGRPQDNLDNILLGMGAGIIIGTIYSTFKYAADARQNAESPPPEPKQEFPSNIRLADRRSAAVPALRLKFEF